MVFKKGFWNTSYDKFIGEEVENVDIDEDIKKADYKALYEAQINKCLSHEKQIKELQEQIKLLQQPKIIEKPVEIAIVQKIPVKKPVVIDDLENDLLELEKELELVKKPTTIKPKAKTIKSKVVVESDDEIEFEINESSNINNFFN